MHGLGIDTSYEKWSQNVELRAFRRISRFIKYTVETIVETQK